MKSRKTQPGFSLLELTVTTAILALVAVSSMALVRTSYTAWNRHEDDQTQRLEAYALINHICRNMRQAQSVAAISTAADNSGALSLLMSNGSTFVWDHDNATKRVNFGVTTASSLLANNIDQFTVVGLKKDGTTQTTEVGLIHSVVITVKYNIVRPTGNELNTVTAQAWVRSW